MKEETFKEYHWHDEEVVKLLRKLGVEGKIISMYCDDDHGLYLHVKTKTDVSGK